MNRSLRKKMKRLDLEELREVASKATQVVSWYPHSASGTDDENVAATVRGPYGRWLKVSTVIEQYKNRVANGVDDAVFAAAAMNNLVPLLDELEKARQRIDELEGILKLESIIMSEDSDASE